MKRELLVTLALIAFYIMSWGTAGAEVTHIDSIEIVPLSPHSWDDVACIAVASDANGDLDGMRFTWIRNGVIVREREFSASGFTDTETDTLSNSLTKEGDEITCRVEAWDRWACHDTGESTVHIREDSVNNPPVIEGIPDKVTEIGEGIRIDLWNYAYDIEDPDSALDFSIDNQGNIDIIECVISGNRYLSCSGGKQLGETSLTVRVTDSGGAWDTDTIIIRVSSTCPWCENTAPDIEDVDIDPDYPDASDELVCEVHVEDDDGNLDSVEFRWYINGHLERTRIRDISGYSDTAIDRLESGRTERGDRVICRAVAEDSMGYEDAGEDHVEIEDSGTCRIDVRNLEVENGDITFRLKNDGNMGTEVEYRIYVDGAREKSGTVYLEEADSRRISFEYDDFDGGEYDIRVWARAECGYTDEEEVTYATEHECSIYIYGPEVRDNNEIAYIVTNTGNRKEDIDYRIYIDNKKVFEDSGYIDDGESKRISFRYYGFEEGREYEIMAWAMAECGDVYSRRIYYRVPEIHPSGAAAGEAGQQGSQAGNSVCNYNQICETGETWNSCPYDCAAPGPEPEPTKVSVKPSSLDIELYKSKVISINIHSYAPQDFSIAVEGVPQDWLDYKPVVNIAGDKTLYVFVNPRETGKHTIIVRVIAQREGLTFTNSVNMFVVPEDEERMEGESNAITGMVAGFFANIYTIFAIIIILSVITAWLGYRHLKEERTLTFERR